MKGKEKRKKSKFKYILVFGLLIYVSSVFINQQLMINDLKDKKIKKQKEVARLKNEIRKVEGKIRYTHSLDYVEKIARDELGMVKSGEIIFIDRNKNKNKFIKGIKD